MRLEFKSAIVELGQKRFNIMTLTHAIKVFACKTDRGYLTIYGDIPGLDVLAYCFAHSAMNNEHIIFLPLRQQGLTNYLEEREGSQAERDLVILHHRLQLNFKDWKSIRSLFNSTKSKDVSVIIDDLLPEKLDKKPYRTYLYQDNKDILNVRDYLHTLFFIGSDQVFGSIANDCKSLSSSEPDKFFDEYPGYHDHKHMDQYMGKHQDSFFAVEFYDEVLWGR